MRIDLYCFPSKLKRQPSRYQNFEAQSHSLFSRYLRLATTITGSRPRLATGGWLDLTRQAFHLLDYSPLSGRTIPICFLPNIYYQISLNPLKILSLSQVNFPLLFPLCYIVPPVFTNSDKGTRGLVDLCSEPTVVERRAATETKKSDNTL